MSTVSERLEAATEKAENASAIADSWANGDENENVTPEPVSGPMPTLKEFMRQNAVALTEATAFPSELAEADSTNLVGGVQAVTITINYSHLKQLGTAPLINGRRYSIVSVYDGWAALAEPLGGGAFVYNASKAKTTHNGGSIIAPEAIQAWNGTKADLATLHTAPASGSGCFIREESTKGQVHIDWFGATKNGTDDSLAVNKALSVGKKTVGSGKYSVAQPIQIKTTGQALEGTGPYLSEFEWIGQRTDANSPTAANTLNMIELWTGRRDLGTPSAARTNMAFRNWKVSTKTGSFVRNLIWVEAGNFHGWVEKIRGFDIRGATPTESILKLDTNNGLSYPVGMNFKDIVLTGGANDSLLPVPIGILIEGAIEAFFECVKVYNVQIGWQFGTPSGAERQVTNCTFNHCHSEIGDRGYADNNGRAMLFYQARQLTFNGCKIVAGADYFAPTAQVPLRFNGVSGFQNKSILFNGCTIWGIGNCANAMTFTSTANYQGVKFKGCEFYQFSGALAIVEGDNVPTIFFDEDNTYVNCRATRSDFNLQSSSYAGGFVNNAAGTQITLQTGSDTSQHRRDDPILIGASFDTQGLMLSAYPNSGTSTVIRAYNRTGSGITLPSGYFYTRALRDDKIRSRATKVFNPPSLNTLTSSSTTIKIRGAALGDFVAVSFDQDMLGVSLFGYVSAPDVVTVYFVNRTSGTVDLGSGSLTVQTLIPDFSEFESATFDAPSLNNGSGTTTTVSVSGANLGDIAVFSLDTDMLGVVGYAWVSATNTVSVRLQNESGGVVDLPSATLRVGVIETPRSF